MCSGATRRLSGCAVAFRGLLIKEFIMKKIALVVSFVLLNSFLAFPQDKTPTDSESVLTAFNKLLDGIRKADLKLVTNVYWNSPRLNLFNYNRTVTKGWEQMRKTRGSPYPEIKDVKLEVRDLNVTMLGRDGALVTCLWSQSQVY